MLIPLKGEPQVYFKPEDFDSLLDRSYINEFVENAKRAAIHSDHRPEIKTPFGIYELAAADFELATGTDVTYTRKL